MLFMNQWDIADAMERYRNDPVLSLATQFLYALSEEANDHSDGWCYWPKPSRAAANLQALIQSGNGTMTDLRRALVPIKAFYTKHGYAAGMRWPEYNI